MSGTPPFVALYISLLALAAFHAEAYGQSDNALAKPSQAIQQMLHTQAAWDQGFDRPPGAHLRFDKVDELDKPEGHFFHYRIYADAAKENTAYIVSVWRIGTSPEQAQVISTSAYVNRKGLLFTQKPRKEQRDSDSVSDGTELDIEVKVARGEPVRVLVNTRDRRTLISGTLVPSPIESADRACLLTALLASPDAEGVLIEGEGFPPNAVIPFDSNSESETKSGTFHTDANGRGFLVELPYVPGKDTGTLKDTITIKDCTVSVEVPWGKGTYHPL